MSHILFFTAVPIIPACAADELAFGEGEGFDCDEGEEMMVAEEVDAGGEYDEEGPASGRADEVGEGEGDDAEAEEQ